MSYNCGLGTTSDSSVISRIGWSAGLIFRYLGRRGKIRGRNPAAELMAACTSRAAPLMSRLRSNWSVTDRGSNRASGCHFRDTRDARELLLERSRDGRRHHVGTRSRQAAADHDGREVDLRQRRDRQ